MNIEISGKIKKSTQTLPTKILTSKSDGQIFWVESDRQILRSRIFHTIPKFIMIKFGQRFFPPKKKNVILYHFRRKKGQAGKRVNKFGRS